LKNSWTKLSGARKLNVLPMLNVERAIEKTD